MHLGKYDRAKEHEQVKPTYMNTTASSKIEHCPTPKKLVDDGLHCINYSIQLYTFAPKCSYLFTYITTIVIVNTVTEWM